MTDHRKKAVHYKSLFVDFHNPEFLEEAFSRFDAEGTVRLIREADPEMVMFWANDHYGNCFYDTELGHKHERLRGDYFGELTRESHRHGMAVFAYYVVGWHNHAVVTHPEWEQVDAEGRPFLPFPSFNWKWACLNSPHRRQCIAEMEEIVRKYDPEGIWIDILLIIPPTCFCRFCREKFRRSRGYVMPADAEAGAVERRALSDFNYRTRYDFLVDARTALKRIKPELVITYNASGDPWLSDVESDGLMDKLSQERSLWKCRWTRTRGKPHEFLVTRGNYAWSDWTIKPPDRLEVEVSTILANGGGVVFGDHGNPDGTLEPEAYRVLAPVLNRMDRIIPWVEGTEQVADIAVLHSVRSYRMSRWLPAEGRGGLVEQRGAYKLLLDAKKLFEFISEEDLGGLEGYRMLIAADQIALSDAEALEIRRFVGNGGILLTTFETGRYREDGGIREDFALGEITGAVSAETSPFSVAYIDGLDPAIAPALPRLPILVSPAAPPAWADARSKLSAALLIRHDGGKALATITHPSCERSPERWVSHAHSNPREKTAYPAALLRKFGRGVSLYLPLPVFRAYGAGSYGLLRDLVAGLLEDIDPQPTVRCSAPLGVEVTCARRGKQTIVYLVNLPHGELGRELKDMQEIRPVSDVEIRLKAESVRRVFLPLQDNAALEFSRAGMYISTRIPRLDAMQIVVFE